MNTQIKIVIFGILIVQTILLSALAYRTWVKPEQTYKTPSLEMGIENTLDERAFMTFLEGQDYKVVYLDVYMDRSHAFDNSDVPGFTFSSLCDDGSAGCGGTEYVIWRLPPPIAESVYAESMGSVYLKGYFLVSPQPGMHQGYTSTVLKEIPYRDAQLMEMMRNMVE